MLVIHACYTCLLYRLVIHACYTGLLYRFVIQACYTGLLYRLVMHTVCVVARPCVSHARRYLLGVKPRAQQEHKDRQAFMTWHQI